MSIETTIKNMEETLEKKKAALREKSAAKVTKLQDRIATKLTKITKLQEQVKAMETECADLVSDENVAGTQTTSETPYVPEKDKTQKDDTKKAPPARKK